MLYLISDETLSSIAGAIRKKLISSEDIDPSNMAELIASIKSGSGGINGSCIDNDTNVIKQEILISVGSSGTTATGTVVEG